MSVYWYAFILSVLCSCLLCIGVYEPSEVIGQVFPEFPRILKRLFTRDTASDIEQTSKITATILLTCLNLSIHIIDVC